MIDFLIDILGEIFDWGKDAGEAIIDTVTGVDLSDVLLIGSTIWVTNLTVTSIKDELRNRQELKAKGAKHVVIKEFFEERDGIVLDLVALNAQNKEIGKLSMKGQSTSGLHVGQKIAI